MALGILPRVGLTEKLLINIIALREWRRGFQIYAMAVTFSAYGKTQCIHSVLLPKLVLGRKPKKCWGFKDPLAIFEIHLPTRGYAFT